MTFDANRYGSIGSSLPQKKVRRIADAETADRWEKHYVSIGAHPTVARAIGKVAGVAQGVTSSVSQLASGTEIAAESAVAQLTETARTGVHDVREAVTVVRGLALAYAKRGKANQAGLSEVDGVNLAAEADLDSDDTLLFRGATTAHAHTDDSTEQVHIGILPLYPSAENDASLTSPTTTHPTTPMVQGLRFEPGHVVGYSAMDGDDFRGLAGDGPVV